MVEADVALSMRWALPIFWDACAYGRHQAMEMPDAAKKKGATWDPRHTGFTAHYVDDLHDGPPPVVRAAEAAPVRAPAHSRRALPDLQRHHARPALDRRPRPRPPWCRARRTRGAPAGRGNGRVRRAVRARGDALARMDSCRVRRAPAGRRGVLPRDRRGGLVRGVLQALERHRQAAAVAGEGFCEAEPDGMLCADAFG
jgi:hypothetical protein